MRGDVVNSGRLVAQIAAESGASTDDVALAQYLRQCADAGRTIGEAAYLIGRDVDAIRDLCCQWQIGFGGLSTDDARLPPIADRRTGIAPARLTPIDAPAVAPAGVSSAALVDPSCSAAQPQTGALL